MAARPDLKKFLIDPEFKEDRDFLEGFVTDLLTRKQAEAEAAKKLSDDAKPKSIFDVLFAGK